MFQGLYKNNVGAALCHIDIFPMEQDNPSNMGCSSLAAFLGLVK